ncbi:MAG: hypothetical protein GC208_09460 [Alphaproteobacteria bacterium]|nr:hypothetical protein [Alphaproteobacteria bacterium]
MNADDIPPLMTPKKLANGKLAWYWSPPTRDRKAGCPLTPVALGTTFAEASTRATELNEALEEWRQGKAPGAIPANEGTFDWLCTIYKKDRRYRSLQPATRQGYDIALHRFASYVLKNGQRMGPQRLQSILPEVADAVYDKLVEQGLTRQAALCMDICRLAWSVGQRKKPLIVPALNPFENMDIDRSSVETRPATSDELDAFCAKAIEMGWPQMAFAARACWDLLQRPVDVFGRLSWAHWRPAERPDSVFVVHHKNRSDDWAILEETDQESGETVLFYPELEDLAALLERKGTLMITRPRLRGRQKAAAVHDPMPKRFYEKLARQIADAAGLPKHVSMRAFRHGGLTEVGDAGLPDTYAQALSRHRQRSSLDRYIHRTNVQQLAATRLRVAHRRGES